MPTQKYNIFDLGLDVHMNKPSSLLSFTPQIDTTPVGALSSVVPSSIRPESFSSGELPNITYVAKQSFTDTANGMRAGLNATGEYQWIIGGSASSVDWNVTTANTLTVTGAIVASSGTIGGFSIGADYIRDVANSFGLASTVTGGDDVRFWAGDTYANRSTAPFRVTEAGVITSISGSIAAFTIAATTLSATNLTLTSGAANTANISVGTGSNLAGMNSGNAGTDIAFWAGDTFANRATAPFRVTLAGVLTATSIPLLAGSIALVRRITTDQEIPSGVDTAIIWNSEVYDTNSYHDNSTNPSRLTAPTDGKYLVTGQLSLDSATWTVTLKVNGATVTNIVAISNTVRVFAIPIEMTATQYVEIFLLQFSGVDQAVMADANGNTSVSITRIGS